MSALSGGPVPKCRRRPSCARRAAPRPDGDDGFALAIVVLLLFSIGLAGAVGYQIVSAEARLSLQSQEASEAHAIAVGALERYMSEMDTAMTDSVGYFIGDGTALIRVREAFGVFPNPTYLVTSEGSFVDPRYPDAPAVRTVRQFVVHKRAPVNVVGAVHIFANDVDFDDYTVDGADQATVADCSEGGQPDVAGIVASGPISIKGGGVSGSPRDSSVADSAALANLLGVPWETLIDPSFSVDYHNSWPNFQSTNPDTFPVIRHMGDETLQWWESGWGLLIIEGEARFRDGFSWRGIILSGAVDNETERRSFVVRGTYVGGIAEPGGNVDFDEDGAFLYHSCNVLAAGRRIQHLAPLESSWWESLF